MYWKAKAIWPFFFILVILGLYFSFTGTYPDPYSDWVVLSLPFILLILYDTWTLGTYRMILFIILSSFIGFIFEAISIRNGTFFGGIYTYHNSGLHILGVPLSVILFWSVFIHLSYGFTNSFLYWLKKDKPTKKNNNLKLLPALIFFDGLFVLIIDLIMDPIHVRYGFWSWTEKGPFFDVPLGNFIGWFSVTIVTTSIIRFSEYFRPIELIDNPKEVHLIPVLVYGLMGIVFTISAINLQMTNLAIFGVILIFPIVLLNLLLFSKSDISS